MIPDFNDGVLPEGVHTCTLEEIAERFGRFDRSNRRQRLTQALMRYIREVRNLRIADALIIDGSFVTMKAEPNDIDLILVLRRAPNPGQELIPAEYNVASKSMVRSLYGFDIRAVTESSPEYRKYIELFSRIRPDDPELNTSERRKGMLRFEL